jgi:hypothetical protein
MAKKSSTVINGINKRPTNSRGVKTEKLSVALSKRTRIKGKPNAAHKTPIKKHVNKQIKPKPLSIEQELFQRTSELQIINSIQQGLGAKLDFQAIVDLVGDKLREVFDTPDLGIRWYDEKTNLVNYLYEYEHGIRQTITSRPPIAGGIFSIMTKTRQPVIWNTEIEGNALASPLP